MPGPAPTARPTLTPEEVAACERRRRRPTAPQAQVARAKLALLLPARPGLDTVAAARQLGRHVHWVFRWRRTRAREGFRLTGRPGRGRRPTFPPPSRWRR
jgi:hypothetical protein